MYLNVTIQNRTDCQAFTVDGRVAVIIHKIAQAAEEIGRMKPGQIVIHVGPESGEVKVIVPKEY